MNAKADNTTTLWAIDVLSRYAPAPLREEAANADYHVECFKRQCERDVELRRLMSLPRVSQPNPADTCGCGAEATHHDYRNGHVYGLCDEC